jgi:hypothetical protein
MADVNNQALKTLVDKMAASLSVASIRDYSNIVKAVVASALDENGEERFPRKWNEKFIDAPLVRHQRQLSTTRAGMSDILLNSAFCAWPIPNALCHPCRLWSASRRRSLRGLEIDNTSPKTSALFISCRRRNAG